MEGGGPDPPPQPCRAPRSRPAGRTPAPHAGAPPARGCVAHRSRGSGTRCAKRGWVGRHFEAGETTVLSGEALAARAARRAGAPPRRGGRRRRRPAGSELRFRAAEADRASRSRRGGRRARPRERAWEEGGREVLGRGTRDAGRGSGPDRTRAPEPAPPPDRTAPVVGRGREVKSQARRRCGGTGRLERGGGPHEAGRECLSVGHRDRERSGGFRGSQSS